jgi:anaerobic ribonucleoside-triphosphate reductase activating protein
MPHEDQHVPLEVAAVLAASAVNGPGQRAVIWLQGCDLRCPGCFNPDFLEVRPARTVRTEVLVEWALGLAGVEGITLSGGEPTLQAEGLVPLCRALQDQGLGVVSYSGHRYEELLDQARSRPALTELLGTLDLLIDGPYERRLAPGGLWRGSANQRLVPLSERYEQACKDADARGLVGAVEVHVAHGSATWTGTFSSSLASEVAALTGRQAGASGLSAERGQQGAADPNGSGCRAELAGRKRLAGRNGDADGRH